MQRLKIEIIDQFVSQRKFAQTTGIHESTISNIILGVMAPSEEQRETIVKVLGISWDDLIKNI